MNEGLEFIVVLFEGGNFSLHLRCGLDQSLLALEDVEESSAWDVIR